MQKPAFLLLTLIITLTGFQSDNQEEQLPVHYSDKAQFIYGDFREYFLKEVSYPLSSRQLNETGVVFLSFLIDKSGHIDSIELINYPSNDLAFAVIEVIKKTSGHWFPTMLQETPINYRYYVACNFQIGKQNSFNKAREMGDQHFEKGNYEEALVQYSTALLLFPYDFELMNKMRQTKIELGYLDEAKNDSIQLFDLQRNFLLSQTITALGN